MPKVKIIQPKKSRKIKQPVSSVRAVNSDSIASDEDVDEQNGSEADSRKSIQDADIDVAENTDFSGGMSNLLERFSSDLNKTMMAKKRKLEQVMQEFAHCTAKKTIESGKVQSCERKKLIDTFQNEIRKILEQSESEIEKSKDNEDKLQKALAQQQKHQQLLRITHAQRLKSLKSLTEDFYEGMNNLESRHVEQYSTVHNDLKKELSMLQKKILMDIQQQEMMNVRKHLKSLLP